MRLSKTDISPLRHARLPLAGNWFPVLALLAFTLSLIFSRYLTLSFFFLVQEDRWILVIEAAVLLVAAIGLGTRLTPLAARSWLPWLIGLALVFFCIVGHYWVLCGYDLSRDEQMAIFDSQVFASGRLVQPLPSIWRGHVQALNTLFMYPAVHHGAWISAYLPGNAALRAVFGLVFIPQISGPLMTGIGAVALWGCARRIWPQDREAPVVALLLYVGSGQVLLTGMTAYAMPAHLAFNLVWLWLFLRRAWWADVAALFVGFIAVGLHQPLMHPMFAGPLLFLLVYERQRPRAGLYVLGYAATGLFWLWWPNWMWALVQAGGIGAQPSGVDYFTRFRDTVLSGSPIGFFTIVLNMLRFIAWQHLLLLPLMWLGWKVARTNALAAALAFGVVLMAIVMAAILPLQGHGFGYRYLHGLIGNAILLAVYGWTSLGERRDTWRALIVRASIAGFIVILPVQLWMAHALYAPMAAASDAIARTPADYAVIGRADAPYTFNLVNNPPALDVRPIRLIGEELDAGTIASICPTAPLVALVGDGMMAPVNAYYGFLPQDVAARRNAVLGPRLEAAGCRIKRVD